ncbi:hypothetical protein Y032_0307g2034 [Ancylostoma ceylanicum]|uniref:Hexosyltransferase n=1 Tax=Ancylostoma ceylanicum TaxID=53326 RepID=A0A016S3N0_9BILA|nr:hypothetical protein Y032_0307g2034 [Ancylostoma ceylanicum]
MRLNCIGQLHHLSSFFKSPEEHEKQVSDSVLERVKPPCYSPSDATMNLERLLVGERRQVHVMLMFFQEHCPGVKYLIKVDDDVAVVMDRMLNRLDEDTVSEHAVYCHMWNTFGPVRFPLSKWYGVEFCDQLRFSQQVLVQKIQKFVPNYILFVFSCVAVGFAEMMK